jgi:hypothetical protein
MSMPQPHWTDVEVEEQRFTTWRNPTPQEVKVDVFAGPGKRKRFVFKAGEEIKVPSEYDKGIHDVRDGVTVGGLAPQLERVAGATPLAAALQPPEPAPEPKAPAPKKPVQALPDLDGAAEKAQRR